MRKAWFIWITSFEKISSRGTCSHIRDVPYRNRNCKWGKYPTLGIVYPLLHNTLNFPYIKWNKEIRCRRSWVTWCSWITEIVEIKRAAITILIPASETNVNTLLLVCLANGYSALLVILSMKKDPAYLLRMLTIFHSSPSLSWILCNIYTCTLSLWPWTVYTCTIRSP